MWRYIGLIPLYLLIACLPLLTAVGQNLEYEYALFTSYLALLILPLAALLTPARLVPYRDGQYTPNIPLDIIWIIFLSPLVVMLPGFLSFVFNFCPCSRTGFFFWMSLQFIPSWILAQGLYQLVLRYRCEGVKPWKILRIGLVFYGAIIAFGLASIWFLPQKRLVNLLIGFIHGPIYDNWIALDAGILYARMGHFFIALFLLSFAWLKKNDLLSRVICGVLLVSSIFVGALAQNFPSVVQGKSHLEKALPATLTGKHFTMHYREEPNKTGPTESIKKLFHEAQFHIDELSKVLGDRTPFVEVYVYPDQGAKKLWFGGGATDVTDVYTPSIHITEAGSPHPTLRHELVHALASELGYHGLGFHPNMAFTEGLAVALAPEERDISLHDGAAALIKSKKFPKISRLFSPLFWQESGSRAYTAAGSIISYLVDTYGVEAVFKLYSGQSWDKAFGKDRQIVLREWLNFVLKNFDEERYELYAESLFRYPGTLGALCPHSKSDLRQTRNMSPFVRLRQPLGWEPERDYWPWRQAMDPDDRYAVSMQLSESVAAAVKDRSVGDSRLKELVREVQKVRNFPPKSLEDIELGILEADVTRLTEGRDASLIILDQLHESAKSKGFGSSLMRQIEARLQVEKELEDPQALPWRRYLAGWRDSLPEKSGYEEPWILTYLRIRRGDKGILNAEYLTTSSGAVITPDLDPTFTTEWYKFLGQRLMQLQAFGSAQEAYELAAKVSRGENKKFYEQSARRAKYYSDL